MSGNSTGQVLGTVTTAAGITVLPNTAGNETMFIMSVVAITAGVTVLLSFAASRIYRHFSN